MNTIGKRIAEYRKKKNLKQDELAEMLGVEKENTAAIGDYFNDYEMLKQVGLPACCGQAPKGMKKIAKLVTCHCNEGAVADLIEYIIQNG